MEFILNETIPIFWKQGYFSFGNQKRIATITDVKFIDDNKLIVAHRAAAKLYILEIINNNYEIKDTLLLKYQDRYFHPDIMTMKDNKIFMTSYENISCFVVFDRVNNKLNLEKIIQIHKHVPYHGCCAKNNLIYYGGVYDRQDNNTPMTVYDDRSNQTLDIKINYHRRIKSITIYQDNFFLLGLDDKKDSPELFNSYIVFYRLENNKLTLLDSIEIEKSQIDGAVMHKNYFFITLHCGIDQCGYIYIGKITDEKKLFFIKKMKCHDFPHGIDIYHDQLAYTSYTNSSITIHSLDEFIVL